MSLEEDAFISKVFKELEEKHRHISLVKGINNKETYYRGDDIFDAIKTTLELFKLH
jgi:hypothetical protein